MPDILTLLEVLGAYLLLCWLTRGIDEPRLRVAIRDTNRFFTYEAEAIESWRVLSPENPYGDCEDNILTAIYIYSGGGLMFLWNVCNIFKFRIWQVADPQGRSHAIATCSAGGFDNHYARLAQIGEYEDAGYKFRFPWPFPLVLVKLLIGKFKG